MAPKKTPILFNFLALVSLVALHCAKTGPFLKGLAQIFQKALQYPRDLVGSLMNLKNSKIFERFFWRHFSLFQFPEKLFDSGKNVNKVKKTLCFKVG